MSGHSFEDLSAHFAGASELPAAEREEYLLLLTAESPELAAEVRRMLASAAVSSDFLEPPTKAGGEEPMRLLSLDFRGVKLGEFELVREIGRGAAGVVYLGEQPSLMRRVAIKILVPQLSNVPRMKERFEREALAASRLRHPSIVGVLAFGELKGLLYLAMEYVEGRSLYQHLEALRLARKTHRPPVSGTIDVSKPLVAAELAAQLADALRYCHAEGVLHRDIKPQNILIDPAGKPRIVDFGLAKDVRVEGITEAGLVSGTLHYMSPEQAQARSSELDARTDVYSLGVVLYEMLTLRRPFEARTDAELVRKVLHSRPIPPHHHDDRIPKSLSAICMRALQKSPEGRYEDAGELLGDLRTYLAGHSIALGARLRFEDAYRYVFLKRPWIGVTGLVVVFGLAIAIAPKALTESDAHAASSSADQLIHRPAQRDAPLPGETMEEAQRRRAETLRKNDILTHLLDGTSPPPDTESK